MNKYSIIIFVVISYVKSQELQTVASVDLKKYAGKWYEISSYPQYFQKNCTNTTAEYIPTDQGYMIVHNRCNKDSILGKVSTINGKIFVVGNSGNAKLQVQFFWPLRSKYWIIDLAEDYSYAVVSQPNKKYLWILSRAPSMDEAIYNKIISRLKEKGFDTDLLRQTHHNVIQNLKQRKN